MTNVKYLLAYAREGTMAWLAHLDTMTCFERSFKRAGIPLAWTSGFNPRPKLVFALPIGLGIECEHDLVEIEVTQDLDLDKLCDHVSQFMPKGLKITEACPVDYGNKSLMSLVKSAYYRIEGPGLGLGFSRFQANKHGQDIILERFHKGKKKPVNISDLILDSAVLDDHSFRYHCLAGSRANLRPDLLLQAIGEDQPGLLESLEGARIVRDKLLLEDY